MSSNAEEVNPERDRILLDKLGARGRTRVNLLLKGSPTTNDPERQAMASPRAVEAFFVFLDRYSFPSTPGVYLTDRNELELLWHTKAGKSVAVQFGDNSIEFVLFDDDVEGCIAYEEMEKLPAVIPQDDVP